MFTLLDHQYVDFSSYLVDARREVHIYILYLLGVELLHFPYFVWDDTCCSVENCRTAMELARQEFGVPMVLEPEYLASPFLDELSGMTYLSYFMKEDSPGFRSTLRWVNSRLKNKPVRNFTVS